MSYIDGPYVQVACFCDSVIEDKSGVLSIIRLIDTIVQNASGENPPEELAPFIQKLNLVISLKSGKARGRNTLKVIPELPTGESRDPIFLTAYFEGEEKGQNFILNIQFDFRFEGLHWFHVFLGDEELTSVPIRIRYQRTVTKIG
jgi:hypothetical protein